MEGFESRDSHFDDATMRPHLIVNPVSNHTRSHFLNRRAFLKAGAGSIAGAAFLSSSRTAYGQPQLPDFFAGLSPSPMVTKYVDPLPIPSVHQPTGLASVTGLTGAPVQAPHYEVPMMEFTQKMHRDLPATRLWGYSGVFPGPSFEVRQGQPISVRFTNNLPNQHMLGYAIDPTLHGAQVGNPTVRTVVHLHGGKVLPESDGNPEAWFTNGFAQKGPSFASDTYQYPNDQPATMLWYHDHAVGITRLNVIAGLAGLYLIRSDEEDALGLPKGAFEIPIVLQDKRFNQDGSIFYPTQGISPEHPVWTPDYLGDVPVVNGKVYPYLVVEPKKYRFRFLNAANARVFNLHLSTGTPFVQIGADQGFLPTPVTVQSLLLSGAERADVIVDFSAFDGQDILLTNDANAPYADAPLGTPPDGANHGPTEVMQFKVRKSNSTPDTSKIPSKMPSNPVDPNASVLTRDIVMSEITTPAMAPIILLLENKMWADPVGVTPKAGSVEIWRFINGVLFGHPMHIHLAEMTVLDRQPFDMGGFYASGNVIPTGPVIPASANEASAPKDTVLVPNSFLTRVAVRFGLPSTATLTSGKAYRYLYHCHVLEHEDNEMMRPMDVIVPTQTTAIASPKTLTTTSLSIQLDASQSTSSDGKPLKYAWTVLPGSPSAAILGGNTATPTVQFTQSHVTYMFQVTVTDSAGNSATDTVSVDYEGY